VFVGRALTGNGLVQFDVERSYKGATPGPVSIGTGPGSCAIAFTPGERYLVFAYRDAAGRLGTHLCTRTRPLSDPRSGADLAVLEAQATGRLPDGFLTGAVVDASPRVGGLPSARGLAGVRVRVTPGDGSPPLVTSSRPDGSYRIDGVPPGPFTITADLPPSFEPATPLRREMTAASCAEVHVEAFVDGRLRGQVLDEQGRPARGIQVQAVNPQAMRTRRAWVPALHTMTDEEGRFEFRRVAAGDYLLGVDLERPASPGTLDRRRFFGETRDPATATVVDLATGEQRELPPFRLVPLPADRAVTILLRAGSPDIAAATEVFLTGASRTPVRDRSDDTMTLRLPFGAAFQVQAVAPAGYRVEPAGGVPVGRDDLDRTIEFTIVKP